MKFKNILLCLGVLSFSTILNSNVFAIEENCDVPNSASNRNSNGRNFEIQKIEKANMMNRIVKNLEKDPSYYRDSENSLFGTYSYNIKINSYLMDNNYSIAKTLEKVEGYVVAKDGSGFRIRYDYLLNNVFFGGGLGYNTYNNSFNIDRSLPSNIEHTVLEGFANAGFLLNTDSAVRPFISVGVGLARVETELKLYYAGQLFEDRYQTNYGNGVVQNKPFLNFETGIRATQDNLLMILGYSYRHIFDLDEYTNSKTLNMTNKCGSSCKHYDINAMKLQTHDLFIGIGFIF